MTHEQAAKVIAEEMLADLKDIAKRLRVFKDRYEKYGQQFGHLLPSGSLDEDFAAVIAEVESMGE
jgi:hypothetical protein